jgi:hypothetical protein
METILPLVLLLSSNNLVHKDRIERVRMVQFVFQNHDTVNVDAKNQKALELYSKHIIQGERILIAACAYFGTGEKVLIEYENLRPSVIKIVEGRNEGVVPKSTIDNIKEIHFHTIALLWEGSYERATDASYYYIQFDVGEKKIHGRYPSVALTFQKHAFIKASIEIQISRNSSQRSDL